VTVVRGLMFWAFKISKVAEAITEGAATKALTEAGITETSDAITEATKSFRFFFFFRAWDFV